MVLKKDGGVPEAPVRAVKKALDILSQLLFADGGHRGFAVKELAEKFHLPANSTHNLLKTLAACGYAEKNSANRYTYGRVCRQIAYANYQTDQVFRRRLENAMVGLTARVGAPAVFCVLDNYAWSSLTRVLPDGRIDPLDLEKVERFYLYETATGRVLYSFSTTAGKKKIQEENPGIEGVWPEYQQDAPKIRRRGGCALMRTRYRSFSVAVPVFRGHELLGALGVYCPPEDAGRGRELLAALKTAAAEITA